MMLISSVPTDLSYVWWKEKVSVTVVLAGMTPPLVGVMVALGPLLEPVQNWVAPRLALCKIRDLSFPVRWPLSEFQTRNMSPIVSGQAFGLVMVSVIVLFPGRVITP